MHVLLLPLSLFLILLLLYPYQSYPFVSVLSWSFLQTHKLLLLMQILAAATLICWAAERSSGGFSFSNFGISLCALTYIFFHFSSSSSTPVLPRTLNIWQPQALQWRYRLVRCDDVLLSHPVRSQA